MKMHFLKSKIHRAVVTDANLAYEGSISIDPVLCKSADLHEFERVEIYNCTNGARLATYVIYGAPGEICLNGAAAHHASPGDLVIIACYAELEAEEVTDHTPELVFVNEKNQIVEAPGPRIHGPKLNSI